MPTTSLGAGVDLSLGLDVWYHLASNFYLYGKAQTKFLNAEAKKSPYISESREGEFWLGFAFKNDKHKPLESSLKSRPYIKVAYGLATVFTTARLYLKTPRSMVTSKAEATTIPSTFSTTFRGVTLYLISHSCISILIRKDITSKTDTKSTVSSV